MALQEKQRLAEVLQRLAPKDPLTNGSDGVLPPWYAQLLELVTRHLRRSNSINDEPRYAEWVVEAQLAKDSSTAAQVFGAGFDPFAAKLLADTCGFLVTVAGLDPGFRTLARHLFAQPATAADPGDSAPKGEQPAPEATTTSEASPAR